MARCACVAIVAWLVASPALAEGRTLAEIREVHEACEAVRHEGARTLYAIDLDAGWHFRRGRTDRGAVVVDTRSNFAALDGRVSILLSRLERIAFDASPEEGTRIVAASRGATMRIGFFLGFDDSARQPCLVRNAHAVTIVRADLAFAELVDASGARLARMETDRLSAWNDDQSALAIPGHGPRGVIGEARFENGQDAPEAWVNALRSSAVRASIASCHAAGIARGAVSDGEVVARLNVETRTGRARRADVALSSIGDGAEAECIAHALGSITLGAAGAGWQAEVVDLAVTVRLTAD